MKKDFSNTKHFLSLDSNIINKVGDGVAYIIRDNCQSAKRDGFKTAKVEIDIKFIFME